MCSLHKHWRLADKTLFRASDGHLTVEANLVKGVEYCQKSLFDLLKCSINRRRDEMVGGSGDRMRRWIGKGSTAKLLSETRNLHKMKSLNVSLNVKSVTKVCLLVILLY